MITKEKAAIITAKLEEIYPKAQCALESDGEGWKLLIMGRLSAQCTDKRVNIVCRDLFMRFPTVEDIAECDILELEEIIRPCGLYRTKAKNIRDACKMLIEKYNGIIPDEMDELLKLPGVGRKIANLLIGDIYKKQAIVADTHCIRICGRLGFYPESMKDPVKVEKILVPLIEPEKSADFCHRIVNFGRDVCTARSPKCSECGLAKFCAHYENEN